MLNGIRLKTIQVPKQCLREIAEQDPLLQSASTRIARPKKKSQVNTKLRIHVKSKLSQLPDIKRRLFVRMTIPHRLHSCFN